MITFSECGELAQDDAKFFDRFGQGFGAAAAAGGVAALTGDGEGAARLAERPGLRCYLAYARRLPRGESRGFVTDAHRYQAGTQNRRESAQGRTIQKAVQPKSAANGLLHHRTTCRNPDRSACGRP